MESLQQSFWKVKCLFFDKGKLSDLEFRLYWEIPAWFYYKWAKRKRGKIRFRRYACLGKTQKTIKCKHLNTIQDCASCDRPMICATRQKVGMEAACLREDFENETDKFIVEAIKEIKK